MNMNSHLECIKVVGKLETVQCAGKAGFGVAHDKSLKAFHNNWSECYRAVIVQTHFSKFIQAGLIVLVLKHDWMFIQGALEDICEDFSNLVCTVLQHPARNTVVTEWNCCFEVCY